MGSTRERGAVRAGGSVVLLAVCLALAFAPVAFAQEASTSGYAGGGGGTQSQVQSGAAADDAAQAGSLPFTGLDIVLVAGGGLLLIVAGAAVAWLARPRSASHLP